MLSLLGFCGCCGCACDAVRRVPDVGPVGKPGISFLNLLVNLGLPRHPRTEVQNPAGASSGGVLLTRTVASEPPNHSGLGKVLGLVVPNSMQLVADEVIECRVPRVYHASRRRGGRMADRGARAAASETAYHRIPRPDHACRHE